MIYNVAIIGAGAAGLYAGANSAPLKDCIIIEKSAAPGKKLLLTGAGQCNLTHGGPIQDFLTHYGQAGHRLRPVLFPCSNQAVMDFFRNQGVPLIQREDGKVFPTSLKSRDVLDALLHFCRKSEVRFRFSASVQALFPCKEDGLWHIQLQNGSHPLTEEPSGGQTRIGKQNLIGVQGSVPRFCADQEPSETIRARRVIVAAGGCSFPVTGSDGSLLPLLKKLGIPLVSSRPALTPIYVQDYPFASLSGISPPDTKLVVRHSETQTLGRQSPGTQTLEKKSSETQTPETQTPEKKSSETQTLEGQSLGTQTSGKRSSAKPAIEVTGPTLLTHTGFSGPGILSLSRYVTTGDELSVSWLPPSVESSLSQALKSPSPEDGNKQIATVLTAFTGLPHRFVELLCLRAQTAPEEKLSQLPASKRKAVLSCLFHDSYSVSGLGGFSAAMVTAGGVALDSVHLKTMESNLYPGLYFAGEILDVDGDTGGYNLQFAFSSGFAAIRHAAASLSQK